MTAAVAVREPTSLVEVHDLCGSIETWAEDCDSVAELQDASNKLAAIGEYLARTSTEGRGRVAVAQRRLEMRIGSLLPKPSPRESGARKGSGATEPLTKNQRHEFRRMAEHPEIVEDVIAQSTDEQPASRRKVQEAIKAEKPRRSPLADDARNAGWSFRKATERLDRIAEDDRFAANKKQVAAQLNDHLLYAIEVCQDLVNKLKEKK